MKRFTVLAVCALVGMVSVACRNIVHGDPDGTLVVMMRPSSSGWGKAPLTVEFEGSYGYEGGIGGKGGPYQWNFGDGKSAQTEEGLAVHEYVNGGSYRACLTVSDGRQSAVACADVTVVP